MSGRQIRLISQRRDADRTKVGKHPIPAAEKSRYCVSCARTVNRHLGIKEQLIFPEIEYDKIDKIRGMDIVICTTAQTDEEARELLTLVGAPFER